MLWFFVFLIKNVKVENTLHTCTRGGITSNWRHKPSHACTLTHTPDHANVCVIQGVYSHLLLSKCYSLLFSLKVLLDHLT